MDTDQKGTSNHAFILLGLVSGIKGVVLLGIVIGRLEYRQKEPTRRQVRVLPMRLG